MQGMVHCMRVRRWGRRVRPRWPDRPGFVIRAIEICSQFGVPILRAVRVVPLSGRRATLAGPARQFSSVSMSASSSAQRQQRVGNGRSRRASAQSEISFNRNEILRESTPVGHHGAWKMGRLVGRLQASSKHLRQGLHSRADLRIDPQRSAAMTPGGRRVPRVKIRVIAGN